VCRSALVTRRQAPLHSLFDREIDRRAIPDTRYAPHPAALVRTLRSIGAAALAASLALACTPIRRRSRCWSGAWRWLQQPGSRAHAQLARQRSLDAGILNKSGRLPSVVGLVRGFMAPAGCLAQL